jgi:hypothetical protein
VSSAKLVVIHVTSQKTKNGNFYKEYQKSSLKRNKTFRAMLRYSYGTTHDPLGSPHTRLETPKILEPFSHRVI